MTVKLTSNKAAAVTDDLAFIVRNAIAYIKVLEAELARCKQVCAATSEAWREEAALAEPVQEPVANDDKVICPACCHQFRAIPPNVQQMMLDAGFEPPFTTPPQRKPLTDDEIKKLLIEHAGMTVVFSEVDLRFARAIERAHGVGGQQ